MSRVRRSPRYGSWAGIVTVLFSAAFMVTPLDTDRWWIGLTIGFLAVAATAPFAYRRANSVSASAKPAWAAAEAVFMVAGMVVFGFSAVYVAINRHGTQFEGMHTRLDSVYFTLTTVATVGYGDIHPVGQLARGIVSLQMLFDLTLLAVSFRLLSSAVRRRVRGVDSA